MAFRDIDPEALGFAIKSMRGGKQYDELSCALNVPIYTSNSYPFDSVQDGADRATMQETVIATVLFPILHGII